MKFKTPEFICINCESIIPWGRQTKLFCSELCQEEAKYIRYHRKAIFEGKANLPDIKQAIDIKRISIVSGGYPLRERTIPQKVRKQVIIKSHGLCQSCGKLGTDIDHIQGSSNDLSNLQLLCILCHNEKTISNFRKVDPLDPKFGSIFLKNLDLDKRIKNRKPFKICDDFKKWESSFRGISNERKKLYYEWVYNFANERSISGISADQIAGKLNNLNVPTFSGLGKWDRKIVGEMLRVQ
ncbi:HNH endonuclease [Leptospira selangorensis]|uniref:HNH endonuclease n=1 Tax=Leptospira selangorensis TaxID=2484982 RepID=UPI001FD3CF7E|nr:HNH endonuclease [Leptospira selangorensis]